MVLTIIRHSISGFWRTILQWLELVTILKYLLYNGTNNFYTQSSNIGSSWHCWHSSVPFYFDSPAFLIFEKNVRCLQYFVIKMWIETRIIPFPYCLKPVFLQTKPYWSFTSTVRADTDGRAVYGMGLLSLAWWDCGFGSRKQHGCLSLVSVVCCQVEVSAVGWLLLRRSFTECGVSECDVETSTTRTLRLTRTVEP
jgi:hypothetical protein